MNNKPNKLINEKSPYLLQHAYNPVEWHPWGEEAFEKAKQANCLIFLSIGYSTCHWCHKMAHDAFSDELTAKYLNDNFVSIKVDREERPDIDEIYMLACELLSENCGWPLNIVITPDKNPIFATTYLPSEKMSGRPSLTEVLKEINDYWKLNPDKVFEDADKILNQIGDLQQLPHKEEISISALEQACDVFIKSFDKEYGGFGVAPKFPMPHNLSFLLKWHKKTNDKYALEMVEATLKSMYQGGIFDHIGGGFHRYATDKKWLIPHFEKMLYDQALVAKVYIEAYQVTNNELYAKIAKKTLDFVLNELTNQEGAFYSGLDADTEGEEGKYYTWTKAKIHELLKSDAEIFCDFYGVTELGNFESGTNILSVSDSIENLSTKYKLSPDEIKQKLDTCSQKLNENRNKRTYPHVDDKIICGWNGLMIQTFAFAAQVFNNDDYKMAAINATNFIIKHLVTPEYIYRSYRDGRSDVKGFLDDYSFLAYGLFELYKLTSDTGFLDRVVELIDTLIAKFYDESKGGFYSTSVDSEEILTRIKSPIDNVMPSGNSIAALVFLNAAKATKNKDYKKYVTKTFNSFGHSVNSFPTAYCQLLITYLESLK